MGSKFCYHQGKIMKTLLIGENNADLDKIFNKLTSYNTDNSNKYNNNENNTTVPKFDNKSKEIILDNINCLETKNYLTKEDCKNDYKENNNDLKVNDTNEECLYVNKITENFKKVKLDIWKINNNEIFQSFWFNIYSKIQFYAIMFVINYEEKKKIDQSIKLMFKTLLREEFQSSVILVIAYQNQKFNEEYIDCDYSKDESSIVLQNENNKRKKVFNFIDNQIELRKAMSKLDFFNLPQHDKYFCLLNIKNWNCLWSQIHELDPYEWLNKPLYDGLIEIINEYL